MIRESINVCQPPWAPRKTRHTSGLPLLVHFPDRSLVHSFSSAPYFPGKPEQDLSVGMKPDCTVGVPKGSPDGKQILTFLFCPDDQQHVGVTLTDTSGSFWEFIVTGFGPDWNPTANP